MFKRLVIVAALLPALVSRAQAAETDLQRDLGRILEEEGLAGVVWMTIDPTHGTQVGATGFADMATQVAMRASSKVHIGSVTKLVLATGILRMVSRGQIELDAPVTDYLDFVSFENPWPETPVTVRHLLDHTAGLEDARLWQVFSSKTAPDAALIESFPKKAEEFEVRSKPGDVFSYSNTGYGLLAMIIEAVAGERYEAYLDKELLAPLGMMDSTFAFVDQEADQALAWGHLEDGQQTKTLPFALRPAGQFTTTMEDLAKLAQFMLADGRLLDGREFIRKDLMDSRGKPFGTIAASQGLVPAYSLGVARRDRHGVVGYCHTGNVIGYYAVLCTFPDEQKAFAFSVNTDSETADYGRISERMIRAIKPKRAVSESVARLPEDIDQWVGYYVLKNSRFDTFRYLDVALGFIELEPKDQSVVAKPFQGKEFTLQHTGGGLYKASNRATTSHVMYVDGQGGRYLSSGFSVFEKVSAGFVLGHLASIIVGLSGFLGLMILGLTRIREKYRTALRPLTPAIIGFLAMVATAATFLFRSFAAIWELTLANVLLTATTAIFPFLLVYSLVLTFRQPASRLKPVTLACNVAVLQWIAVMVLYGQWPLMLWT